MKIFIILICILVISSCANHHYPKFDYDNGPNPWINAFKDKVFLNILKESYQSDTIFKLIEKKDAFVPYDGLGLEAIQQAKKIAINLVKNMPPPSLCENCLNGMNYYMANALHYYRSMQLDLIARKEYKKYKHSLKINTLKSANL